MGYAISYTSLEPVTAEQWKAIRECVTQLNKSYTWLSCEPIHFSREEDGSLDGASKPNFDPAPEDRASAATLGLPDGSIRELLDGLCLISRRCGVDWEIGDDHTQVIGYIRQGDFDDAVWGHINGLAEATSFTQAMTGEEHFDDPDDLGDSDPEDENDGPPIFRFPVR